MSPSRTRLLQMASTTRTPRLQGRHFPRTSRTWPVERSTNGVLASRRNPSPSLVCGSKSERETELGSGLSERTSTSVIPPRTFARFPRVIDMVGERSRTDNGGALAIDSRYPRSLTLLLLQLRLSGADACACGTGRRQLQVLAPPTCFGRKQWIPVARTEQSPSYHPRTSGDHDPCLDSTLRPYLSRSSRQSGSRTRRSLPR